MDHVDDGLVARLRAAGCVFAEDEAEVLRSSAPDAAELERLVQRRCAGEPLEHVVGWAQLCGVRVAVEPGVFVPRRRSELLVRTAASLLTVDDVVVDLCCGAGALGLAVAALVPGVQVVASDLDPGAVAVARRNLRAVSARVVQGDLYDALPTSLRGDVAVVVANVPYVPTDEVASLPAEAREHEPLLALDGGPDGLDVARRVVAGAVGWLRPGGHVLVETTPEQATVLEAWVQTCGGRARTLEDDELGACVVQATYG